MTNKDEQPELRDVEAIAPAPKGVATDTGAATDTGDDVDRVGITAAGGSGAVGVVAESMPVEPVTLDPERDDASRNAAGGGWEGVNEVIENDFETEQLRKD